MYVIATLKKSDTETDIIIGSEHFAFDEVEVFEDPKQGNQRYNELLYLGFNVVALNYFRIESNVLKHKVEEMKHNLGVDSGFMQ